MAKVQFSDVLPPDKRSVRNISISRSKKRQVNVSETEGATSERVEVSPKVNIQSSFTSARVPEEREEPQVKSSSAYEFYYPKKESPVSLSPKRSRSVIIGGVILALSLIFIFGMLTVFSSASVILTPKNQKLQVSLDFKASKDPIATSSVRYEVLKITKSSSVSVEATGEEFVEEKASGKIMIYNDFSSEPQRLITRTRFETPEGLIYRISESVVVPGKTSQGPGSIEVQVFADEAGDKYNINKTDFTIPGFKNDAERYKSFYARSVTNMSGGFSGKRKTVSEQEKSAALAQIGATLESDAVKDLSSKVPSGLVLLDGAVVFDSREIPQKEDSSKVLVGREVDAYAILLNAADLSKLVAGKYLEGNPEWQNIPSSISDFSGLKVTKMPTTVPSSGNIDLGLGGEAIILANVDLNSVVQKLSGIEKKNINSLIEGMPNVASMKVTLRPVWKQSFPENPSKIDVKIEDFVE